MTDYYKKYIKYKTKYMLLTGGSLATKSSKKSTKTRQVSRSIKLNNFILKKLTTPSFEVTYKIPNRDYTPNYLREIARIKAFKHIQQKYPDLDLTTIFLEEYANNKNNIDDPVLCNNIVIPDKTSQLYINNYFTQEIQKIKKIQEIQNNNIQVIIIKKDNIVTLSLNEIRVNINKDTYERILTQIIIKPKYNINLIIWCLLYRYQHLGLLTGVQGAVLPKYYKNIKANYNCNLECFGSFINHTLDYYCGLFYDLEHYFGCLGNFFNITLIKGFFVANPPFITSVMNKMINMFLEFLNNNQISLFIVMPVWDTYDREQLNKFCVKKLKTDYVAELLSSKLRESKYVKNYLLYCQESFDYFNFIDNHQVNYSASNVIFLTSQDKVNLNLELLPKFDIDLVKN
jgi:hypothetical protein